MKNLLYIFKWNFIRFFSKSNDNEWLSENTSTDNSFCAKAITAIVKRKGAKWLLPVNLTLFLLGLFFVVADDYIQAHTLSFVIHIICIALVCIFMILKFDAWKVNDNKNILKLMYIFCMSITGGYASLTYIFLIIYENIIAYGSWGGI